MLLLSFLFSLPLLAPVSWTPTSGTGLGPTCVAGADGIEEELRHLRVWLQRARRNRGGAGAERLGELRDLLASLGETDRRGALAPELSERLTQGLLDLVALGESRGREHRSIHAGAASPFGGAGSSGSDWREIADLGRGALRGRIERDPGALGERLASPLKTPQAVSTKQLTATIAVLDVLRGQYLEPTMAPLVSIVDAPAEDGSAAASRYALEALIGWPDPRVTDFLLARAESRSSDTTGALDLARHLDRLETPPAGSTLDRVRTLVARLIQSDSWRDAARALELSRTLDSERMVPVLIEALELWSSRQGTEQGSKRIRGTIVSALRRRSARSLGADSAPWRRWWELVRTGRVALPASTEQQGELYSSAPFFGLRLETDRVIFVLDNSGSMASPFRTDGSTRYETAIQELIGFLHASGPETRFQIALFSDRGRMWQRNPTLASEKNLLRAERWLRSKHPGGGTMLFEGLREALNLDRDGHLRNAHPEADTVVVLCDGATAEGKGWVLPWLRRENGLAQLVFQCVRIGKRGDGTLKTLAAATGGDCIEVE